MPDSGWDEDDVHGGYIDEAPYEAFAGGSYIPLPAALAAKKAIVNVKNNDDECLRWALKSARFPVAKNGDRTSRYPDNDGLNWEGIEFPLKVPQIRKLEKQNVGLAINVFGWENGDLTILWISDKSKAIKRINLMLVMDGENSHYCWNKGHGAPSLQQNETHKKAVLLRCLPVAFHLRKSFGNAPGAMRGSKWAPDAHRYAQKRGKTR